MSQLIYLENSELFYVEGEIPEKPAPVMCDVPLREATSEEIDRSAFKNHLKGYESVLASLKAKGVRVGNEYEDAMTIVWAATNDTLMKEGEFYPLECEVEYSCNADCDVNVGVCCHPDCCIKLAVLTPKREPAWLEYRNCPRCNGTGVQGFSLIPPNTPCSECEGTGTVEREPALAEKCSNCGLTGSHHHWCAYREGHGELYSQVEKVEDSQDGYRIPGSMAFSKPTEVKDLWDEMRNAIGGCSTWGNAKSILKSKYTITRKQ